MKKHSHRLRSVRCLTRTSGKERVREVLVLAIAICWLGCQEPAKQAVSGEALLMRLDADVQTESAQSPAQFRVIRPPAGLEVLELRTGAALEKASLRLEQITAGLEQPDYLKTEARPEARDIPDEAVRNYVLGRLAWRDGDRREAIERLELANQLDPKSPEILHLLGWILFDFDNEGQAVSRLKQAISLDSSDSLSLFLLGRAAFRQQNWNEAVAVLAASENIEEGGLDPTIEYLRPYFLGQSLLAMGHDAAGMRQFLMILDLPEEYPRASTVLRALYRDIAFLARQRSVLRIQCGDALCRMGRYTEALDQYQQAQEEDEAGDVSAELLQRQVYALLSLSRPLAAEQAVLKVLASADRPQQWLGLVGYLAEHGADAGQFMGRLRALYEKAGRPTSLVLALDDQLGEKDNHQLLVDHLLARPEDAVVYRRLVEKLITTDRKRLLDVSLRLIASKPALARDYATLLSDQWPADAVAEEWQKPYEQNEQLAPPAWYLKGAMLEASGRYTDAIDAYDRALKSGKSFDSPYLSMVQLMVRLRRFDEAEALLKRISADNRSPEVLEAQVRVKLARGQNKEAMSLVDELITREPRRTGYLLLKADVHEALGENAQVEQLLVTSLSVDPMNEQIYERLFAFYESDLGQYARRWLELWQQVRQRIPASRIARFKTADWLTERGQTERAETLLRELLDENPADGVVLLNLRNLLARANRWDEAARLLLAHMEKRPDDATPLLLYEAVAEQMEQIEDYYRRREAFLLRQKPGFEVSIEKFILYSPRKWDKPEKALAALEESLRLNPKAPVDVRKQLAASYAELKQFDRATAVLDKAIEDFPDQKADLLYAKASIFYNGPERVRYEQILLQALQAQPNHPGANNDLSYFWAEENKNLDKALEMARKAVASEQDNPAYLDSLGWVHYKLGQFPDAIKRLEEASTKPGFQDPVIMDHLGDAFWRQGRKREAVIQWRKAQLQANRPEHNGRADVEKLRNLIPAKIDATTKNQEPAVAPVPEVKKEEKKQ